MEIVHKRMELMLQELEQMRRTNLFTVEECKDITKKRKHFEYKINSLCKNLQDFQDYIKYECDLRETIRHRRNTMRMGEKLGSIEHKQLSRIKELFQRIIERFPDDTTQALAYFKFCKEIKYVSAASVAVSTMLKKHSHNAEVWKVAAKWHEYDRNDKSTALKTLCKGLALHKQSKLLYTEMIELQIRNCNESTLSGNSNAFKFKSDDTKLCLEKLETYFKEITNNITDCEYYVEVLGLLVDNPFTEPVQKTIITYMVQKYPYKAVTWNMLAHRERRGLPNYPDFDCKGAFVATTKAKLRKCIETYKEGLVKVAESEKEQLWWFYINCLSDVRNDDSGVATKFKADSLIEAFEKASEANYLFEGYYMQWLELVNKSDKPRIMEKGINRFPQSLELWKFNLKTTMLIDNREAVKRIFTLGVQALKEKALPLWMAYIRYHLLCSDDTTIEAIYKEGVKQPQEISDILKPDFIEWLCVSKSTNYTRDQYMALANQKPYCKELHVAMFKLETMEVVMDFEFCDRIHELACEQFGTEDVEVWSNRIQYYADYKQGKVSKNAFEKVFKDAEKALPPLLFTEFRDGKNPM